MVRIAGVTIPQDKRIEVGLTYIFGIGRNLSKKILSELNINLDKRTSELSPEEAHSLRTVIEKQYRVEGELRRDVLSNVKRFKDIGCYRGTRHAKNLPCRGQRTKTNARTLRGKRKTMGSGRKSPAQKT